MCIACFLEQRQPSPTPSSSSSSCKDKGEDDCEQLKQKLRGVLLTEGSSDRITALKDRLQAILEGRPEPPPPSGNKAWLGSPASSQPLPQEIKQVMLDMYAPIGPHTERPKSQISPKEPRREESTNALKGEEVGRQRCMDMKVKFVKEEGTAPVSNYD